MRGYRINPNREYVDKIITGLHKKDGHCPCRVEINETILCPCERFINEGKCCCKLFIPIQSN